MFGVYTVLTLMRRTQCSPKFQVFKSVIKSHVSKKYFTYYYLTLSMPTTWKQRKEARNSKDADMLSDIKNLDIMLGGNRLEREGNKFSKSGRRPDGPSYNTLMNQDFNFHSNSRGGDIRSCS